MHTVLYTGGKILTFCSQISCEAMAIRDGRILFIGSLEKAYEVVGKNIEIRELSGDVLMPSFLDAHSHFTAFAATLRLVPLGGCRR